MDEHPLDRPIWNSLLTSQKSLASGTGLARRYPADVSPFADVSNSSAESLQALSEMIRQTGLAIALDHVFV